VLVISGFAAIDDAVEAIKRGACDYLVKPLETVRVFNAVRLATERRNLKRENRRLRMRMLKAYGDERLVVASPAMQSTMAIVDAVSNTDTSVLIEGESGTGKEIIAKSIHRRSRRSDEPLVPVNCGALPESLLESELFGYEKGAFTGAHHAKVGLFEAAHGGTILLDEIGELPLNLQSSLLRVLQENEIRRLGGTKSLKIDVRVIAVTNRNLVRMVRDGQFREDLYYRLRIVPIRVPALRERTEDIIPLTKYFLDHYGRAIGKEFHGIDEDAGRFLVRNEWRGNVRELENLIHAVVVLSPSGSLTLSQIAAVVTMGRDTTAPATIDDAPDEFTTLIKERSDAERRSIVEALKRHDGHQSRAAQFLGISRTSLWRKMKKYRISTLS
ncbi:MAG: sigma-54 dependent transcriptional regulator, partial [Spirochaetales bacterium]|nr:sigma-54 dependent transcriptional regulator [Spirochaetales bacterium]